MPQNFFRREYYPFGLQHDYGASDPRSQKQGREHNYGLNGTELNKDLGIDLYEMPLRSYDPTIARWTTQDPVIHHGLSPYNAFDNNPVYFADPSGGNSVFGTRCSWCRDESDRNSHYDGQVYMQKEQIEIMGGDPYDIRGADGYTDEEWHLKTSVLHGGEAINAGLLQDYYLGQALESHINAGIKADVSRLRGLGLTIRDPLARATRATTGEGKLYYPGDKVPNGDVASGNWPPLDGAFTLGLRLLGIGAEEISRPSFGSMLFYSSIINSSAGLHYGSIQKSDFLIGSNSYRNLTSFTESGRGSLTYGGSWYQNGGLQAARQASRFAKISNGIGVGLSLLSAANDVHLYNTNQISGKRLSYRLGVSGLSFASGFLTTSIISGSSGGPVGTAVGAGVGIIGATGETFYDLINTIGDNFPTVQWNSSYWGSY